MVMHHLHHTVFVQIALSTHRGPSHAQSSAFEDQHSFSSWLAGYTLSKVACNVRFSRRKNKGPA